MDKGLIILLTKKTAIGRLFCIVLIIQYLVCIDVI